MSEGLNEKEVLKNFVEEQKDSIDLRLKELIVTSVLAIATLLTGWCSYQADNWSDIERDFLEERYEILQNEAENTIAGYQLKAAHSNLVLRILENRKAGNIEISDYLMRFADSALRNAVEEWIKLESENNPNTPRTPLLMSSYEVRFKQLSEELRNASFELRKKAKESNTISDKYLSLTVFLAMVLFFAGISGTLRSKTSQIICLSVTIVILVVSIILLVRLPV